jgi:hypothetical protein
MLKKNRTVLCAGTKVHMWAASGYSCSRKHYNYAGQLRTFSAISDTQLSTSLPFVGVLDCALSEGIGETT